MTYSIIITTLFLSISFSLDCLATKLIPPEDFPLSHILPEGNSGAEVVLEQYADLMEFKHPMREIIRELFKENEISVYQVYLRGFWDAEATQSDDQKWTMRTWLDYQHARIVCSDYMSQLHDIEREMVNLGNARTIFAKKNKNMEVLTRWRLAQCRYKASTYWTGYNRKPIFDEFLGLYHELKELELDADYAKKEYMLFLATYSKIIYDNAGNQIWRDSFPIPPEKVLNDFLNLASESLTDPTLEQLPAPPQIVLQGESRLANFFTDNNGSFSFLSSSELIQFGAKGPIAAEVFGWTFSILHFWNQDIQATYALTQWINQWCIDQPPNAVENKVCSLRQKYPGAFEEPTFSKKIGQHAKNIWEYLW